MAEKNPVQTDPAHVQESGELPQGFPRQASWVVLVGPRFVTNAAQIWPAPQSLSAAQSDPVVTTLVQRPAWHSAANAWPALVSVCPSSAMPAWKQPRTAQPGTQAW
jgi:hypothetical protein